VSDFGNSTPPDPSDPGGGPPTPPPPPFGQAPVVPPGPGQPYGQPGPGPQHGSPGFGQPYGQPPASPPQNYLVWAILSTLFCCLPLGIVSIVFASQVNGKYQAGDFAGALDSSNKAKQFAIWSAIIGVIVIVIYIAVVAGSTSET
jgi:hypothetical protein